MMSPGVPAPGQGVAKGRFNRTIPDEPGAFVSFSCADRNAFPGADGRGGTGFDGGTTVARH